MAKRRTLPEIDVSLNAMISHRGAEIRREVNKMVSCGAALRHGQRGETRRRIALVTVAAAVLAACAAPAEHYDRTAARLGLERAAVVGGDFVHIMYRAAARLPGRRLHIYLEGDGTPLLNARIAHADPTPRMPVMLTLLVLDPRPAVLLGRPCYHGAAAPRCTTEAWTEGRYAPAIVRSMVAIARRLMAEGGYEYAALLGHSGGGALALLMAARMPEVESVVTVAGNLDTEAWAEPRGVSLGASLNPATVPRREDLHELHLAGGRDNVVPAELVRASRR